MKTVGSLLRETRESQFYSLEDVERRTKIRKEMLSLLENDDFEHLPPATFVRGFIKNYGKLLGLDQEKLLALWRRDFESKKHPPMVMKSFSDPLKTPSFRLTPQYVFGTIVLVLVLGFFGYLWVEYRQFVGAPELMVVSPNDQLTVEIPQVIVEGKTAPEVIVKVNEQQIEVDKDGKFREEIKLSAATNKIVVSAVGKFGQKSSVERVVYVKK